MAHPSGSDLERLNRLLNELARERVTVSASEVELVATAALRTCASPAYSAPPAPHRSRGQPGLARPPPAACAGDGGSGGRRRQARGHLPTHDRPGHHPGQCHDPGGSHARHSRDNRA
jgi:hypothetical protein